MELGIGMFGDLTIDLHTEKIQPVDERYREIIEEVKLADDTGIDVFLMGEHHRPDYAVPAPEMMLSALSSITKRIKLSSGVSVLSSADPVKVYQDFAMLDLLSGQRAEITAGRGSFIESFPLFGYDLSDYNELFEEKLELLNQLNENEIINWKGKYRAALKDQTIYPRPGKPLPIWIAVGGTPASVVRAAKYGMPIIFAIIGGNISHFQPLVQLYKETYRKFGHDPQKMEIAVHSHTFLADSKEDLIHHYYPYYAAQMNRIGKDRGWPPYSKDQFLHGMEEDGALFMGKTEAVAEKIIRTAKQFGLTRFVAHLDVGGPEHPEMMKAIRLYGKKVLPMVKDQI